VVRRACVLAALLTLTLLAVSSAVEADAAAAKVTIVVTSVSLTYKEHDVPPTGASKGDTTVFHDTLLNAKRQFGKKAGTRVGSDSGTMTFTSAHTARLTGKAVFPGGTIRISGPITGYTDGSISAPVTGGTGLYDGVTGVLVVAKGTAKRAKNTYVLAPSSAPVA
jgi:hypothetical protein